jgi:hypothetical protein
MRATTRLLIYNNVYLSNQFPNISFLLGVHSEKSRRDITLITRHFSGGYAGQQLHLVLQGH